MQKEKISVIVPVYNNAPWLPRCLDSLLAQTCENLEIIVVDDGSTDDSYEVMSDYAARNCGIKVIRKTNGGVTSARLRGVAEASGDWIGFVDGDDFVEPDMYARLLENACRYEADISHCGYRVVLPDGSVFFHHNSATLRQQDRHMALRDLLEEHIIEPGLCSKLYKRELLQGLENRMDFTIKNNEDLLMNYYLFEKAEKAVFEDFCPYHYIARDGSASRRKLNEHKIYDPIRVKQIILECCEPALRDDVRHSLLRTMLFVYSLLSLEKDREYDVHRSKVRQMLAGEKQHVHLLSRRNQLLANMICSAPWLFGMAYGMYVKYIEKDEYK